LSAFTTKTAVYALIRGFPGTELLIYIGLFMVCYGIIYAILENDLRRILAYSIVNQVGFMVIAVGIGTELALNGAAAHAFAHIVYKGLLVMAAGSVLLMTGGRRKITELGGLARTMPWTCLLGLVGALTMAGFPLTAGFPAKSLIPSAAGKEHLALVWFMLAAASAGVVLSAGLVQLPWFRLRQQGGGSQTDPGGSQGPGVLQGPGVSPDKASEPPWNMMLAMAALALVCIVVGVAPNLLYDRLPYDIAYHAYTPAHVVYKLQLLLFSGLAFFLLLGLLKRTPTITLDFDWFYRVFGRIVVGRIVALALSAWDTVLEGGSLAGARLARGLHRHHGPGGILGRRWPTGNMAFWTTLILGGSLLAYYLR